MSGVVFVGRLLLACCWRCRAYGPLPSPPRFFLSSFVLLLLFLLVLSEQNKVKIWVRACWRRGAAQGCGGAEGGLWAAGCGAAMAACLDK